MRDSIAFEDLQVNKEASLRYIGKLLRRLDAQPDGVECLNEVMRKDKDVPTTPFTHQLCVVYVDLDGVDTPGHVDDCMELFRRALQDEASRDRSQHIRLYKGCAISGDIIHLTAFLHDTPFECDVSYTQFKYNPKYRMWMMDDCPEAPHGLDDSNMVWVLDFGRCDVQETEASVK